MQTKTSPPTRGRITLRRRTFDAWCRRRWGSDVRQTDVAARLGIHPTTLSQLRMGRRAVGAATIETIMHALPGATFEELFSLDRA